MSKTHPELPPRVFPKGRWYYLVTAEAGKRVWTKLTEIRHGLPDLYRKLADLSAKDVAPDKVPAVVAEWMAEVMPAHAKKTQANDRWAMGAIAEAFAEFPASKVTTPDCLEFLKDYRDRPRTHNLMRHALMELMRYAEGKAHEGVPYRPPNSNPVASIKRLSTPARDRYPTDSEVRRIKYHALVSRPGRWGDQHRNKSGPMLAALIDLAYLTGQRVGDLLNLRWDKRAATEGGEVVAPYIAREGLYFKPSKTAGSTGAKVLITWTPKLQAVIARIKAFKKPSVVPLEAARLDAARYVITNKDGKRLLYSTFATAWWRACDRADIKGLHFHDLRAKAITDTKKQRGIKDAQIMGAHSTEGQTVDYVREMQAQETEATR